MHRYRVAAYPKSGMSGEDQIKRPLYILAGWIPTRSLNIARGGIDESEFDGTKAERHVKTARVDIGMG